MGGKYRLVAAIVSAALACFLGSQTMAQQRPLQSGRYKHQWLNVRDDQAPLWCGKAYEPQYPAVDPGGRTVSPGKASVQILDFQCYTQMNTYFHGESSANVIFELKKTHSIFPRAQKDPDHIYVNESNMKLKLALGSLVQWVELTDDLMYANFTVDLETFRPSHEVYNLCCSASSDSQAIRRIAEMFHLPPRATSGGSLTKLDRLSGLTLINSTTTGKSLDKWEPFQPYGYYGEPKNLQDLADQGFNILHHVPDISTAPNAGYPSDYMEMLEEAANLGLWVMHDMRWTWQHPTLLAQQINKIKDVPNLLTWYTGDEPDGTTDNPKDFYASTQLVRNLDSRYHVVSTVLNCADFYFEEYSRDLDIILSDPYPIGLVSARTHEGIYHTPCNSTYGCCGCDDCSTSTIKDVYTRLQKVKENLNVIGQKSAVWIVPQGFGGSEHWSGSPTVQEELATQIIALGSTTGSVSWNYQPEVDGPDESLSDENRKKRESVLAIRAVSSKMARLLPEIKDILFDPKRGSEFMDCSTESGLYQCTWTNSSHVLLSFVNPGIAMTEALQILVPGMTASSKLVNLIGDSEHYVTEGVLYIVAQHSISAALWMINVPN